MGKYRKSVEAIQWFRNGDHPKDESIGEPLSEGKIVRRYRRPDDDGGRKCEKCGKTMHNHGWIDTPEGGHVVCPGDWIITDATGKHYPCMSGIFKATYEKETGQEEEWREKIRRWFESALSWQKEAVRWHKDRAEELVAPPKMEE